MSVVISKTWNCTYKVGIFEKLQSFYDQQQFVDVILIAEKDNFKIHAHRIVLSASSDYFRTMFSSSLKEANPHNAAEGIILKNIDGPTLKAVVNFMYTASIELEYTNIVNVIKAADFFQMNTFKAICCDLLVEQLDSYNCLGIASFAEQYNLNDLHKLSTEFSLVNFNNVARHEEFLQLNAKQLMDLLSSDKLCVKSEEDVFNSLKAWINYDGDNRRKHTAVLLHVVRFSLLSSSFINAAACFLKQIPECEDIVCSWLRWHSQAYEKQLHAPRKLKTKFAVLSESTEHFILHIFDINSKSWSSDKLPFPPQMVTAFATVVMNNKLIIVGGELLYEGMEATNIVQCFDLLSRKWSYMPAMQEARTDSVAIEVNEELFVFGGLRKLTKLTSIEKYSFINGKWHNFTPLRSFFQQSDVQIAHLDGKLYVNGGHYSTIYCFDPSSNEWSEIENFNNDSYMPSIFTDVKNLYAVGGTLDGDLYSDAVYRYDSKNNKWSTVAPLSLPRAGLKCFAINNRIIACGGYNEHTDHHCIEEYNPAKNKWTVLCSQMPSWRDSSKWFSL